MCMHDVRLTMMKIKATENGYIVKDNYERQWSFESFENLMRFIRENLELREPQHKCPRLM
jgi:hypothetical protein